MGNPDTTNIGQLSHRTKTSKNKTQKTKKASKYEPHKKNTIRVKKEMLLLLQSNTKSPRFAVVSVIFMYVSQFVMVCEGSLSCLCYVHVDLPLLCQCLCCRHRSASVMSMFSSLFWLCYICCRHCPASVM